MHPDTNSSYAVRTLHRDLCVECRSILLRSLEYGIKMVAISQGRLAVWALSRYLWSSSKAYQTVTPISAYWSEIATYSGTSIPIWDYGRQRRATRFVHNVGFRALRIVLAYEVEESALGKSPLQQFQVMLEDVREGKFDALVASSRQVSIPDGGMCPRRSLWSLQWMFIWSMYGLFRKEKPGRTRGYSRVWRRHYGTGRFSEPA